MTVQEDRLPSDIDLVYEFLRVHRGQNHQMALAISQSPAGGQALKFLKSTSEYKGFVEQRLLELASKAASVSNPISTVNNSISLDERVIELCHGGNVTALAHFLKNNRTVWRDYKDWAAWRYCISKKDEKLCKVLLDHFGPSIMTASNVFTSACLSGDRETAEFLFDLDPLSLTLNPSMIVTVCSKGFINLANKILDAWEPNEHMSLINMLIYAIHGAIDSGHEGMFNAMLNRYISEFTIAQRHYNRGILMIAAMRGQPLFLKKILDKLVFEYCVDFEQKYYAFTVDKGFSMFTGGLVKTFKGCCSDKNPLMVEYLMQALGSVAIGEEYFECLSIACQNGHINAIKFFLGKHTFDKVFELFRVCIDEDSIDAARLLVNKYGSALISNIEADPQAKVPAVRLILHEYYLDKAKSYED